MKKMIVTFLTGLALSLNLYSQQQASDASTLKPEQNLEKTQAQATKEIRKKIKKQDQKNLKTPSEAAQEATK